MLNAKRWSFPSTPHLNPRNTHAPFYCVHSWFLSPGIMNPPITKHISNTSATHQQHGSFPCYHECNMACTRKLSCTKKENKKEKIVSSKLAGCRVQVGSCSRPCFTKRDKVLYWRCSRVWNCIEGVQGCGIRGPRMWYSRSSNVVFEVLPLYSRSSRPWFTMCDRGLYSYLGLKV